MILRSISVQGWRCLHDPVEVGPFTDGINVIHAPNGTGKSTLFEALQRAMLDGHRVKGQEVESIRPWGRNLVPTVTVEFFHGGTEYQLTKQFLDRPRSELKRKEGGRFVRLAEGDPADKAVQEFLTKTPPRKGLARPEHWGLAQVLWAPQGDLALRGLKGELVTDIHQLLGAQVSGPGSNHIESKIKDWYLSYYTPTGLLKSGNDAPKLVSIDAQLKEAIARQQDRQEQQKEFEDLTRKVEDLRARKAEVNRLAQDYERKLAAKRPEADKYAALLQERSRCEGQATGTQAQHAALKQRADAINDNRKQLEDANENLTRLTDERVLRERETKMREGEAEQATAELENVRKERPQTKQAQDEAELARRYLEAKKKEGPLRDRITKLQELFRAQATLSSERGTILAPDSKTLANIRKAMTARDEARVRLEAALITVQVVAVKKGSLEVVEGEGPGTRRLSKGSPVEVKGSPQVVVDLPGVGRIRAWGPAASIDELRDAMEKHSDKVIALTREFGTADIGKLEELRADAAAADQKLERVETQISTVLSGQSKEDTDKELRNELAVVTEILQQRPQWENNPPNYRKLQENAELIRQRFVERVEAAERARDTAHIALSKARELRIGTEASLSEAAKLVRSLTNTLKDLTKDGKTDAERQNELGEFALKWDAAKAGLQKVQKTLATFESDPGSDMENLAKLQRSAENTAKDALAEEKKAEGKLEQLSSQGTYSALAETEEQVAFLRDELAIEKLNVDAASLLHTVCEECRREMVAQISEPVERTASEILRRIAGGRLGTIHLGEAFEPTAILPEAIGQPVALENASGGEKEQIYIAIRLALAKVLAQGERQLVVLDDVLTSTDSGRLARVLRVLGEAAQHLQIVILTCHPERYGALDQAKLFDMESLVKT